MGTEDGRAGRQGSRLGLPGDLELPARTTRGARASGGNGGDCRRQISQRSPLKLAAVDARTRTATTVGQWSCYCGVQPAFVVLGL
jgi:hypothetical protein